MSDQDPTGAAIAAAAPTALRDKATMAWSRMAVLAIAAGVMIGFGGIAFLVVQAGPAVTGATQLLSGFAFASGLMMVMVTSAELFTGNVMIALPVTIGRLGAGRMLGAWSMVWIGNLVGSVALALLFVGAGGLDGVDGGIGRAAARVAGSKLDKGVGAIFASGILANALVCLAVWMAMGARSLSAKALALAGPVTVFVAAGFEHSVANMSLIPIGLLAGAEGDGLAVARNLAASTAGNVVGGLAVALCLGRAFPRQSERAAPQSIGRAPRSKVQ